MSGQDEERLSDVEAAIERRLLTWSDETDVVAPPASSHGFSGREKSKRRKKRRRSVRTSQDCVDPVSDAPSKDACAAEQNLLARSGSVDTSRRTRALEATLVRPRAVNPSLIGRRAATPNLPPRVVADSVDIDADLRRAVGGQRSGGPHGGILLPKDGVDADESETAMVFVEKHRREVVELGATALAKKDRRAFEERQRREQGCRPLKQQKMPLPMLLGIRKKQRARETKAKELALASGMLIKSKRKNK